MDKLACMHMQAKQGEDERGRGKQFRQILCNTDVISSYLVNEGEQTLCDKRVKTPSRQTSLNSLL